MISEPKQSLHLLPEWFIQLAGREPKELTALWAETSASQPKNNIALAEMATVCLFFQQKGGKKQLLVLLVTEKVKNRREKNKIIVKENERLGANFSPWLHFSGCLVFPGL